MAADLVSGIEKGGRDVSPIRLLTEDLRYLLAQSSNVGSFPKSLFVLHRASEMACVGSRSGGEVML
jgi:hypothetical protein